MQLQADGGADHGRPRCAAIAASARRAAGCASIAAAVAGMRRRHAMRLRYPAGVWELFLPDVGPGA
ncbi:hypothetical protein WLU71_24810, partial [Bordetella bronchiseptica]